MGFTERLARASAAHPRRTLALWGVAVLVALGLVATSLHGLTSNSHVVGNPESTKAADAVAQAFPRLAESAKGDFIVVSSSRYRASSPRFKTFVGHLAGELKATGNVDGGHVAAVSSNGHAVLIALLIGSDSGADPVEQLVEQANGGAFSVGVTGYRTANRDFGKQSQTDLEKGELAFGLPAALLVLVLVFGAVVAGLVPVLMAILSIIVALGFVAVISLEFSLSVFIVNMLTGMGLALGIDYSLFVVSRYREERGHGLAKENAIARTGATASRAVLFSGSTFVIALLGMFIVPTSIMRSLALGAILVGIVSVAAALTLLPALLSLVGDRVNALPVPVLGRNLGRADAVEGHFWRRIVDGVLRRPVLWLTVAVVGLLAAASPIFGLHIGAGTISASSGKQVYLLTVPLRGDPAGTSAVAAVRELRGRLIPTVFADGGARVYVGGQTAEDVDYFDAVTNPTPYVLLFVLGLSFILLTIAFRSIVVAAVSVLLNLLSVAAAYGLLTLVFLDDRGASLFGFEHTSVIDAWVPLFLFSVLFGLSMDYQVFLMSRIKERYD